MIGINGWASKIDSESPPATLRAGGTKAAEARNRVEVGGIGGSLR